VQSGTALLSIVVDRCAIFSAPSTVTRIISLAVVVQLLVPARPPLAFTANPNTGARDRDATATWAGRAIIGAGHAGHMMVEKASDQVSAARPISG
jgi:hypothetical protein